MPRAGNLNVRRLPPISSGLLRFFVSSRIVANSIPDVPGVVNGASSERPIKKFRSEILKFLESGNVNRTLDIDGIQGYSGINTYPDNGENKYIFISRLYVDRLSKLFGPKKKCE